jgi:holo-ACP synthase/triphosphoribosyl-dephospho-CoA synthase
MEDSMDLLELYTGEEVSLPELLDRREARSLRQRQLLAEGRHSLVSFTMNIPGPVKCFPLAEQAFDEGLRQINRQLERHGITVFRREESRARTGYEALFLTGMESQKIKELMIIIEETHPLGRLFDIDVLGNREKQESREALAYTGRTCIVCGGPARVCSRSRAHGLDELRRTVMNTLRNYAIAQFEVSVLGCVQRALLWEVAVSPKPGLVDRNNSGAHQDMDLFTFQDSITALMPWMSRFIRAGIFHGELPAEKLLPELRFIGIQAEEAMRAATKGANTHRGIIFSLGLICAALGRLYGSNRPVSLPEVLKLAGELAQPALGDFDGLTLQNCHSHGEKLYVLYGITGIRGEAAGRFPSLTAHGLPILRRSLERGLSLNDAAAITLLCLIAHVEDTNLISRSDFETQKHVQNEVKKILLQIDENPSLEPLFELDRFFIAKNLSPGGSADLLALTLFFHFLFPEVKRFLTNEKALPEFAKSQIPVSASLFCNMDTSELSSVRKPLSIASEPLPDESRIEES